MLMKWRFWQFELKEGVILGYKFNYVKNLPLFKSFAMGNVNFDFIHTQGYIAFFCIIFFVVNEVQIC